MKLQQPNPRITKKKQKTILGSDDLQKQTPHS
jgi:hypothetical protein